jgi:hypothetical protein
MKSSIATILLLALGIPAMAMSDQQQEQLARASASLRASMEQSDRDMKAYYAARAAENHAKCAKLGGVAMGMAPAQVLKSCWGKPLSINETLTARGKHEQWVYSGGYVYLDGGLVTAIQSKH